MTKKVMELIDERTGLMKCKVRGFEHQAQVKPESNGKFFKGSWQCDKGCKLE